MLLVINLLFFYFILLASKVYSEGSDYYYEYWCNGHHLQYLDDSFCQKVFPSNYNRDFQCKKQYNNIIDFKNLPSGYHKYQGINEDFINKNYVDVDTLTKIIPDSAKDVRLCLTLSKHVRNNDNIDNDDLYVKYYCNGNDSLYNAHETWSSSKIYAIAAAASQLRSNKSMKKSIVNINSNNNGDTYSDRNKHKHIDDQVDLSEIYCSNIGLNSTNARTTSSSNHSYIALGDLATIITSYDETMGYTSNSLAAWFNSLAQRDYENKLIQSWVSSSNDDNRSQKRAESTKDGEDLQWLELQSLGGDYGEDEPSDLAGPPIILRSSSSSNNNNNGNNDKEVVYCMVPPDNSDKYSNTLSALTQADLILRIVQHRDIEKEFRYPSVTWNDMQQILYGSGGSYESSSNGNMSSNENENEDEDGGLFPEQWWGGMTADTAIFVQSGLNMTFVEEKSDGRWRIFSKLGAGYSSSRGVGEIITTAYACVPSSSSSSSSSSNSEEDVRWVEFSLSVRGSVPLDLSLLGVQKQVEDATTAVVHAIDEGRLV